MYWNYWPFLDNSVHFMYFKIFYKFNKSEEQFRKAKPLMLLGADYAHHITASPPRFENPAAAL